MGKKILIVGFGVIVSFLVSLILDRVWGWYWFGRAETTLMIPRVREDYDMLESHWVATISAQGIRDEFVPIVKPAGQYRMLVLGDSIAYGWGVDAPDRWTNILEKKLRESSVSARIINAAAPGVTFDTEYLACRAYVDRFQADAVVVSAFLFDDLYQIGNIEAQTPFIQKVFRFFWPNVYYSRHNPIASQWYKVPPGAIVSSKEKWSAFSRAQSVLHPDWYTDLDPQVRGNLFGGALNPSFFGPFSGDQDYQVRLLNPEYQSQALQATRMWLVKLKACAGRRPLVVLGIPSATMISRDFFPYREALKFTVTEKLLTFDVDHIMKPVVEGSGGMYIGLTAQLRRSPCRECYFQWDRHLNRIGNDFVAQMLVQPVIELMKAAQK